MSWNDSASYLKALANKAGITGHEVHEDHGLPLAAHIGALVSLQSSPLLSAALAGSFIQAGDTANLPIKAISRLKLDFPGAIHRYYFETGDDAPTGSYIQIVSDKNGTPVEAMYCKQLSRFIPESEEDQDNFTATKQQGLGAKVYTFYADQLEPGSVAQQALPQIFNNQESIEYFREPGSDDQEWYPPFEGSEERIDDTQGIHGQRQDIWFVPYVRQIGQQREYLLITTKILRSKDGDDDASSIYVDFDAGIPIELARISIL